MIYTTIGVTAKIETTIIKVIIVFFIVCLDIILCFSIFFGSQIVCIISNISLTHNTPTFPASPSPPQ